MNKIGIFFIIICLQVLTETQKQQGKAITP